jgi:5'-3' exonuclease
VAAFKALVGDTSDTYPGVKGIGRVKAVDLLHQYSSLEAIVEHLEQIVPERNKRLLQEGLPLLHLCYDLARVRLDVPVPQELLQDKGLLQNGKQP